MPAYSRKCTYNIMSLGCSIWSIFLSSKIPALGMLKFFERKKAKPIKPTFRNEAQFLKNAALMKDELTRLYDKFHPNEKPTDYWMGGANYGKTVQWVIDYASSPAAVLSIEQALRSVVAWPKAGYLAWAMRRFIKHSGLETTIDGTEIFYDNRPKIAELGNMIRSTAHKIGTNYEPTEDLVHLFDVKVDYVYYLRKFEIPQLAQESEDVMRILPVHAKRVNGALSVWYRFLQDSASKRERKANGKE
jgi:hypothetical protein